VVGGDEPKPYSITVVPISLAHPPFRLLDVKHLRLGSLEDWKVVEAVLRLFITSSTLPSHLLDPPSSSSVHCRVDVPLPAGTTDDLQ